MSFVKTVDHFIALCRTGIADPSLDIKPERAQIYHNLFKNHVNETLLLAYPITRHLLHPKKWTALVDAFVKEGISASPFLWQMPKFFLEFVKRMQLKKELKIPYLDDLLDFEWLEIDLFMTPDLPVPEYDLKGNVMHAPLCLNPENAFATYQYPVYEKGFSSKKLKRGIYPIFSFRHPKTHQARFIAISQFFFYVLQELKKYPQPGKGLVVRAAKLFKIEDTTLVLKTAERFFSDLVSQCAIYTRPH